MEATQKAGALDVQGALHIAIRGGWESAVAKLLSLGADAALKDEVRACSHRNTCMCSVHVCIFVDALRMGISISITRIITHIIRYSHMIALTSIMYVCDSHMII